MIKRIFAIGDRRGRIGRRMAGFTKKQATNLLEQVRGVVQGVSEQNEVSEADVDRAFRGSKLGLETVFGADTEHLQKLAKISRALNAYAVRDVRTVLDTALDEITIFWEEGPRETAMSAR